MQEGIPRPARSAQAGYSLGRYRTIESRASLGAQTLRLRLADWQTAL